MISKPRVNRLSLYQASIRTGKPMTMILSAVKRKAIDGILELSRHGDRGERLLWFVDVDSLDAWAADPGPELTHTFNGLAKTNPNSRPARGATRPSSMKRIEEILEKRQLPREVWE